jgi:hypothetical protein
MYQLNNKKNLNADYLDIFLRQLDDRVCAQPETNTYNYSLLVNDNKDISKPNCKIDQDFSQGNTGDCWLLASIKAIASRPKGLKILNESIKVDEFGNTVVTLKGVNKTYVISPEELNSNIAYAQGDGDIRALEIAVNKYIEEKRGINMRLDINGGYGNVAYLILIGDKNFVANNIGKFNNKNKIFENNLTDEFNYRNKTFDDNLIDEFNNIDKIFTVSSSKNIESITIDENGDTHILTRRHAYAVIRSDTKYVYLVNPWDSKIEFKITRELFKEFFNRIYMLDL